MHYEFENAIWFVNLEGTLSITSAHIPDWATGEIHQSSLIPKQKTHPYSAAFIHLYFVLVTMMHRNR